MASTIRPSISGILERFQAVLYPFQPEVLLERLPELGWIVQSEVDDSSVRLTTPASIGNVRLVLDQATKTLGVRGIEMNETLERYVELRKFARASFGLPPMVRSYYTEMRYVGTVDIGTRADARALPEILDDWWAGHERAERFAEVLKKEFPGEEDFGVYGLRMATRRVDPNRPNWSEFTMTPLSTSGNRFYRFEVLYRNEDASIVEQVARNINRIVLAAASELES